jgi:hypothetical protein
MPAYLAAAYLPYVVAIASNSKSQESTSKDEE